MTHVPWNEPFDRFAQVYAEAQRVQPQDPNAVSLATVSADGRPSVRVVLMKDFDPRGFVFYTNHTSRKGRELLEQKVACLNFFWPALGQQVRVEGVVEPVPMEEADQYFATRPRVSQLGAWASHQSQPLDSRETLEQRLEEVTKQYEGQPVPRPGHWGGFRLKPDRIEFWRAHQYRLHWREEYVQAGDGWKKGWVNP
ncbi:MAG: pyridoxine/pyridoxamine 5'-phosphate oxidase [Myxococcaceae bacterium]